MDREQAQRIAENEARFRAVNDRISAAIGEFRGGHGRATFPIMCECAVTECDEMVEITAEQYDHVRSSDRWFAVRPEHVIEAAERRVEDHGTWWLIEKIGVGGKLAEALVHLQQSR